MELTLELDRGAGQWNFTLELDLGVRAYGSTLRFYPRPQGSSQGFTLFFYLRPQGSSLGSPYGFTLDPGFEPRVYFRVRAQTHSGAGPWSWTLGFERRVLPLGCTLDPRVRA